MVHHDWNVGHNLHYYKVFYYCISFIAPGVAFIFFPVLAAIIHLKYLFDKKKPKPKPTESDGEPTESDGANNPIFRDHNNSREGYEAIGNNDSDSCCCSWNCCAEGLLKLTIGTSQFFFGSTTVQLKDKISYNDHKHCLKIGNRYYELSFWTLLPLAWSNACVLASLTAVFFAYFIIKETDNCDESLDCFVADESNTTRITDCSTYDELRIKVKCYEISSLQFLYAFSFIGGLLKFVPILFKLVIFCFLSEKSKYKTTKCRILLFLVNIVAVLSFLVGFILFLILLFKHPTSKPALDFVQINTTMKRLGLGMSILAQVVSIFLYPWYILNGYIIKQKDLKPDLKEEIEKHLRSQDKSNSESPTT